MSFYSDTGRFMGRVEGPIRGNVLLRTRQYDAAKAPVLSSAIAQVVILCKLGNSRTVLLRAAREAGDGGHVNRSACRKPRRNWRSGRSTDRRSDADSIRAWRVLQPKPISRR
jgi:CRISPR/Cas system-associated endonuclease Cas1